MSILCTSAYVISLENLNYPTVILGIYCGALGTFIPHFGNYGCKSLLLKKVVCRPAVVVFPRSMLEIQNLLPHSSPTENQTAFNKIFRRSYDF